MKFSCCICPLDCNGWVNTPPGVLSPHTGDQHMNIYNPSTPRTALGLTAIAMAVITMGVLVVLPATFDSVSTDPFVLTAARAATVTPTAGAISPTRIDIPEVDAKLHAVLDRTTVEAQASRGKPHKSRSRS